ncbi:DUF1289 domain-containing protein [Frigidibacter sp. MR17.24]|uniref:DUF1289 domain-containing protein n=1 Tax=Frigidibacter sp. MR17.24 TaxID=3127345 RepID=UPI003012B04C
MTDEIWARDEVESPCVKVCVMHPAEGLCLGCWRTLDEIAAWGTMPAAERRALVAALPDRAERVKARRRGGRAARVPRP